MRIERIINSFWKVTALDQSPLSSHPYRKMWLHEKITTKLRYYFAVRVSDLYVIIEIHGWNRVFRPADTFVPISALWFLSSVVNHERLYSWFPPEPTKVENADIKEQLWMESTDSINAYLSTLFLGVKTQRFVRGTFYRTLFVRPFAVTFVTTVTIMPLLIFQRTLSNDIISGPLPGRRRIFDLYMIYHVLGWY